MRAAARLFAGFSPNTLLLALSSLFADVSTEMQYPVLPVFLTQTLGADGAIVGLVDGCAQALQNVAQGFSGALSDRLQRRKPVALAGYLLAAIAKPLMGLASSWPQAFGARCLDRLGAGSRSAPRDALIASSVDEKNRGRAFGLEGLGDNTGALLGPLITVALLHTLHLQLRRVFYLTVIPGLLALLMILLVREPPVAVPSKVKPDVGSWRLPPAYWRYLLVTALFCIGNSSNAFLILRLRDAGASLEMTILVYAAFNGVAALASYPAGSLADRCGRRNMLLAGYGIFVMAYLGFAASSTLPVLAASFALYGLFQGVFRVAGKSFASDLAPDLLRASGLGWYSMTVGLLQLVASLVAGVLWDRASHAAVFYYGAASGAVGIVALALMVPDNRRTSRT